MTRLLKLTAGAALALCTALAANAAPKTAYLRTDLVSDGAAPAAHVDPNLVNPWGIAFNPTGFVWLSDNASGRSTLYDGAGNPQSLVVEIPTPGTATGGTPTGIVFSGSTGFVVSNGTTSGPSRFIFATQDGVIAGWAPNVDGTHALVAKDDSDEGALYTGLAIADTGSGQRLYTADFFNARIEAYDAKFADVELGEDAFKDPAIPSDYAPFNVQALGGEIYVAYAKSSKDHEDEVAGAGLGFVSVYDLDGRLQRHLVAQGALDAPWGLALAPATYGPAAGALLVGNFGDGTINAYDRMTGAYRGALRDVNHKPIVIDGLWGIAFGNGVQGQSPDKLYFAAGPDDETHGIYGSLEVVASTK